MKHSSVPYLSLADQVDLGVFGQAGVVGNVRDIARAQVEPAANVAETVHTQDAPEFAQSIRDVLRTCIDACDCERGLNLQNVFMRKGSSVPQLQKRVVGITSVAPNAKIAGRDSIGVKVDTEGCT